MKNTLSRLGVRLYVLGGVMALAISLLAPIKAYATDLEWSTRSPMQMGRAAAGAAAIDGKVYVTSGVNNDGFLASTEVFDTVTNTWQSKAPIPTVRASFGAVSYDGKFYALGGQGESTFALTSVEMYDPATNSWSTRAPMPIGLAGCRAVVSNGKIYVIGGRDQNANFTNKVEVYNPTTDSWEIKAPMSTPRTEHALAVTDDGTIYAIGGYNGHGLKTTEAYDPTTNSWSSRADLPIDRLDHAAETVNGHVIVAGGIGGQQSGPAVASAAVYDYDPVADTWTSAPSMSVARSNLTLTAISNHLFAIGGEYNFVTIPVRSDVVEEGLFPGPPLPPTNLTTAPYTKTSPVLNWSTVSGASSYNVYRNSQVIATNVTVATFTNNAPAPAEGTYNYYVTSVNGLGESGRSNIVSTTVDRTRPVVAIISPTSFVGPFAQGPIVTVQVSDATPLTSMAIHVYTSANQLLTTCGSATPTQLAAHSMSCNLASLPNGTYYIKTGAFDSANNNGTTNSGMFTIVS